MYNNYLMHYGVKGMKWGVRHDRPLSGRSARKERKTLYKQAEKNYKEGYKTGERKRHISGRTARKERSQIYKQIEKDYKDQYKSNSVEKKKEKRRRDEKIKTNVSKMRNYTGSNKSDALKSARRKDINKMSNADLQKTVNRLNLERQYRDLTKVKLTPGKKYVDSYTDYNKSISQARKAASTVAIKKAMTAAAV